MIALWSPPASSTFEHANVVDCASVFSATLVATTFEMPKSEKDEMLSILSKRIFSAMVDDLVMDAALQAHHDVAKSRAVCSVCNTRCGLGEPKICFRQQSLHQTYTPQAHASSPSTSQASCGPGTPSASASKATNGTGTPSSSKADNIIYVTCSNCSRQIASSRFAPHLSSCMGLASARRAAPRAVTKAKVPSEAGRSISPSDMGFSSDDDRPLKNKARFKSKQTDEAEFSLKKRKRPSSPLSSASPKKSKVVPDHSPASKARPISGLPKNGRLNNTNATSPAKVPSKLREMSTAPRKDASSRSSTSPISPAFPKSPVVSARAPVVNPNGLWQGGNNLFRPPTAQKGSPVQVPAISVQHYTMGQWNVLFDTLVREAHTKIDDDTGDETGSSTDTSDSG
ncbi:hypothetical protein FISHEDRAFT_71008 [Fistulina hepatica ATCC 64428]|uniref:SAGA-associated factor 11 n=1 Tax=Fistulina hepatica ATCC 64428 TaxID=1128425 RepID=A0A0D7AKS6_9AGAR|nr:hypothetical protein FISHEDRAFT_71008 [Fistulina hepatica ATCC 64428]